jgi:hypothetical protein
MHNVFKMMPPLPADEVGTADRQGKPIEAIASPKASPIAHQAPDGARAA